MAHTEHSVDLEMPFLTLRAQIEFMAQIGAESILVTSSKNVPSSNARSAPSSVLLRS